VAGALSEVKPREVIHLQVFRGLSTGPAGGPAGLGVSKDVIVVTETDVQQYGDNPSLVIYPALHEGKELYRAR